MSAKAEAIEASKVGVFGMILIGICSLLLGVVSQLFTMGRIVYVTSMAGVLFPLVMVTVGALVIWARENSLEYFETPESSRKNSILPSLAAGLLATLGGAFLSGLTLPGGPGSYMSGFNVYGYLGIAILIAIYVILAVIGGVLYGVVLPAEKDGIF